MIIPISIYLKDDTVVQGYFLIPEDNSGTIGDTILVVR